MATVKKYRTYCNTETAFVTGWLDQEPTTCFNNNTHTIDTNQTTMVDIVSPASVKIAQTDDPSLDNSKYHIMSTYYEMKVGETKDILIPIKYRMNMFQVTIYTDGVVKADTYDVSVNRDTIVGTALETGTDLKEVKVSQTVIDNAIVGYYVKFGSGARHLITEVKTDTLVIDTATDATTGDLAYLTYFIIKNKHLMSGVPEVLGGAVIGSSLLLAGDVGCVTYRNDSNCVKRVTINMETTF